MMIILILKAPDRSQAPPIQIPIQLIRKALVIVSLNNKKFILVTNLFCFFFLQNQKKSLSLLQVRPRLPPPPNLVSSLAAVLQVILVTFRALWVPPPLQLPPQLRPLPVSLITLILRMRRILKVATTITTIRRRTRECRVMRTSMGSPIRRLSIRPLSLDRVFLLVC